MNASGDTGTGRSAFDAGGPEAFGNAAALGREALERTMRMTAQATVRACRGAVAAGTAQLEAAEAMREKMGVGGNGSGPTRAAVSVSSEAAIAGFESCMEKTIDWTRAASDAGAETVGRTLAARTIDEWLTVQIDSANRMMNLGLAQSAEFARIVTDTSRRCADPLRARGEDAEQAS